MKSLITLVITILFACGATAQSDTIRIPLIGPSGIGSVTAASGLENVNSSTLKLADSVRTGIYSGLASKQGTLVSGTNIKTINSTSLLGSGNLVISGGTSTIDQVVTAATNGQTAFVFSSLPTRYIVFINGNATKSFTSGGATITLTITNVLSGDEVRVFETQ